jgi:hypothetical protein
MKNVCCALVAAVALAFAQSARAQEFALKAGVGISRFETDSPLAFNEDLVAPAYGGHYRLKLGPVWLQPEVMLVAKGGVDTSDEAIEQRIRLEYLELPLLIVLPARVGRFEPYAFGGPLIALETRCRHIIEEEGLKTNQGCETLNEEVFDRRVFDYGVTAGAGLGHPIGSGKLFLEGRHTWGLRDIADDNVITGVRNRSIVIALGYTLDVSER